MTRRPVLDKQAFFASLGYRPHPGQLAVHESRAPRRVLACGVRWGKSMCAAMEALAAAMAPGERTKGWVAAPTYDLADKVFREIVFLASEHLRHFIVSMKTNDKALVLRNLGGSTSEIRAKSADNPVSLLGEGLDFLIVDEAARLKPAIWTNHLSQRLVDRRGWSLLISTPRGKGWFWDECRRGQGGDGSYESWSSPSWENPHLDRDLIEAQRRLLPERAFRQEYGAEWIEGSGAVFRNVRECATGSWRAPEAGETYYGGLDLARTEDWTVLVIVDSRERVCFVDRFHRLPWTTQVARIKAASERYFQPRINVDTTGVGEPIYDALRREELWVRPYPFTAKSKAALIDNLVLHFEQRQVELPRVELWPEGVEELEAFEFDVTESGHVRTGAPAGMHDDIVIGLALALWGARSRHVRLVW
jgi:hypothetical protein